MNSKLKETKNNLTLATKIASHIKDQIGDRSTLHYYDIVESVVRLTGKYPDFHDLVMLMESDTSKRNIVRIPRPSLIFTNNVHPNNMVFDGVEVSIPNAIKARIHGQIPMDLLARTRDYDLLNQIDDFLIPEIINHRYGEITIDKTDVFVNGSMLPGIKLKFRGGIKIRAFNSSSIVFEDTTSMWLYEKMIAIPGDQVKKVYGVALSEDSNALNRFLEIGRVKSFDLRNLNGVLKDTVMDELDGLAKYIPINTAYKAPCMEHWMYE